MGQYKKRQLTLNRWLREREGEASLVRRAEQAAARGAPEPPGIGKTFERVAGPRAPRRLYHWWDEPGSVKRRIDAGYVRRKLEEKAAELGAPTITALLQRKLGLTRSQTTTYILWYGKKSDAIEVRTSTLRRFCMLLGIPFEELERLGVIRDRRFPFDLHSPAVAKLYTHILNEGSLTGALPRLEAKYVNRDPVLHRIVIDLVKELGGQYKIPPPSKEGIETRIDSTTGRILVAAGLPPGRKVISNPPLHPAVLRDRELAIYHVHTTFIEEGYSTLTLNRHGKLELHVSFGRNVDVTNLIPHHIRERLVNNYKGKSLSPLAVGDDVTYDILTNRFNAPLALIQEYFLIRNILREYNPDLKMPSIRCSYVHVSKEGRVTANYEFSIRSRNAVQAFYEAFFEDFHTGTWKEEKLRRQVELLHEYGDRKLAPSEAQEVKQEMAQWRTVPNNWILEKIRELLPEADWINNPKYARRILK